MVRNNNLTHNPEPCSGERQQHGSLQEMPRGVGMIFHRERQQFVEHLRINTLRKAEKSRDTHGHVHIFGDGIKLDVRFCRLVPEGKIRKLDTDRKERTYCSDFKPDCQQGVMRLGSPGDGHGLGYEPVEERHTGNGYRTDHIQKHDHRQFSDQSAETVKIGSAGSIKHGTNTHEEQPFIENVGVSVSHSTVDAHGRTDTDTGNHITDLRNNVVGKNPARVVLHGRVKHSVDSHDCSGHRQRVDSRESSGQNIDRGLGGESAHENCTGDSSFGVGIRQPCVQRYHSCVDAESGQDQPIVVFHAVGVHRQEGESSDFGISEQQSAEQEEPAEHVKQKNT